MTFENTPWGYDESAAVLPLLLYDRAVKHSSAPGVSAHKRFDITGRVKQCWIKAGGQMSNPGQEILNAAAEAAAETAEAGSEYMENGECCCGGRKKVRSEKEHKDLINRLNRIEGQIRGIKGMVEKDAYCIDILNQASAASSALSSFCKVLLSSHIRSCVAEDVRQGNEDKMEELVKTLQKMMR